MSSNRTAGPPQGGGGGGGGGARHPPAGGVSFRPAGPRGRREMRLIEAFKSLYFLANVNRITSDGFVSRLHVLTAVLLLTFSIMVTTKQAVGNSIDCIHTREISVEVFNAYCWTHSTYFVTGAMLGVAGVNVAAPGVGSSGHHRHRHHHHHHHHHHRQHQGQHERPGVDDELTKQVKYYQWVAFVLFFQDL